MLKEKGSHIRLLLKHITFLFSLVCAMDSMAQANPSIKTFSTSDGLSINTINALQFDKNQYLWIGTSDGLQRYDGYEFKTFKHKEGDSTSLAANEVYALYLDEEENLWITGHKTISIKRKNSYVFLDIGKIIPNQQNKDYSLVSEDAATVGIVQPDAGVFYINKKTLTVERFSNRKFEAFHYLKNISLNPPAVFINNQFKQLWIATADSLFHFYDKKIEALPLKAKKPCYFFNITNDTLLVISDTVFLSVVSSPLVPIKTLTTKGTALNPLHIITQYNLGNNQILFSSSIQKMYIVNTATLTISPYEANDDIQKTALLDLVYSMAKDAYGNIWLGFNGRGGMAMIRKKQDKFSNIPTSHKHMPYSVYKHTDGIIYSSGFREGVFVFSDKGKFIREINMVKNSNSIRGIASIDDNNLLLKYCEAEALVYNIPTNKVVSITSKLPYLSSKQRGNVYNFNVCTQPVNGEVLFNYDTLVCAVKKGKEGFMVHKLYDLPDVVHWFHFNEKHHWVATKNAIYDYKNRAEKIIQFPAYVYIKQINEKRNDTIWVATTTGIYIIHNKNIIRKIDENNGLRNSFVYGILFDNNNNAWASTNKGLAVVYPDYSITSFTKEQGLIGEEFNTGCFYKSPDGNMYFAGVNGIVSFDPQKVLQPSINTKVVLNSIEVNNKDWLPHIASESLSNIDLQHDENLIKLSFGLNDFTSPQSNQFKIQLTYPDGKTSILNKSNTVQFVLEPGNYLVSVWAMGHEGYWNKEPLVLHLNIHPAWYQTLWFKIFVPTCIVLLALWLLYFILRRKQRKQIQKLLFEQQVQQEKERLSRDLHDNLGSQLTLLINNVNLLKPEQTDGYSSVKEVKQNASSMMQSLRQTLWIMNHESITLLAFTDKVMEHAFKYVKAFPSIELNIERQQHEKEQLLISSNIAMQLFPIMQEALTNACKHSQATNIYLGFIYKDDCFELFVKDDGNGFVVNNVSFIESFGLKNMKSRSTTINSKLVIESEQGKGTCITVELPYAGLKQQE